MFSPTSDTWRRINQRTGQALVRVSRQKSQDDISVQPGPVRPKSAGISSEQTGGSLEHLASCQTVYGRAPKTEAFLRNLKSMQTFQSSIGVGDNREKLADYLKQCECSMPKHGNAQLAEIDPDLQTAWVRPSTGKSSLTSKAMRQQAVIWELFQTELNILRHLKTIIEIYVTVIHYLQANASLLNDVSTEKLFPSIAEVFGAHCTLWQGHLKPALLKAQGSEQPVQPLDFAPGFANFQVIFQPLLHFCLRIADCKDYLKQLEKNDAFNDFVRWAQKLSAKNYNSEDGSMDLQLKSLLTTPFQRLTKYGLLLQEILKHTEDSESREALDQMIRCVTDFCNRVNTRYQEKADEEEVRGVSERLEDAKLIEQIDSVGLCPGSLDQYRLSLSRPMPHNGQARRKLAESDFKMKDDRGKWSDVKLLLFTDLLLVAKVGNKKQNLRLLRPPVRLDKLAVHQLSETNSFVLAVLTDFNSLDSLICLSAADPKLCDDWLERLSQSQAAVKAQLLAPSATAVGADARCVNCGFDAAAVAIRPRPVQRWMSETAGQQQQLRSQKQQLGRATLLEVATASQRQQLVQSSSEDGQLQRSHVWVQRQQQQQLHLLHQQQLRQHCHTRDNSAPAGQDRSKMLHEHLRCNSADEPSDAGAVAASVPVKELTPERKRLIGFINPASQAPQV